jgi:hypothetical protein
MGAAMEMYLAGVPVYIIMLISRWLSNAFLHYIQKQVKQFSKDIAKKMLMHCSFWTIPDVAPCTVSNDDPGNAIIKTMLKQGKILNATCHNGCNYQPSPSSTDQATMWGN